MKPALFSIVLHREPGQSLYYASCLGEEYSGTSPDEALGHAVREAVLQEDDTILVNVQLLMED